MGPVLSLSPTARVPISLFIEKGAEAPGGSSSSGWGLCREKRDKRITEDNGPVSLEMQQETRDPTQASCKVKTNTGHCSQIAIHIPTITHMNRHIHTHTYISHIHTNSIHTHTTHMHKGKKHLKNPFFQHYLPYEYILYYTTGSSLFIAFHI